MGFQSACFPSDVRNYTKGLSTNWEIKCCWNQKTGLLTNSTFRERSWSKRRKDKKRNKPETSIKIDLEDRKGSSTTYDSSKAQQRKKKTSYLAVHAMKRLSQVRQQKATLLQTPNFSSGLCLLQLSISFLFFKEYPPCCGRMCMQFAMAVTQTAILCWFWINSFWLWK